MVKENRKSIFQFTKMANSLSHVFLLPLFCCKSITLSEKLKNSFLLSNFDRFNHFWSYFELKKLEKKKWYAVVYPDLIICDQQLLTFTFV